MFCSKCGKEIQGNDKFCRYCGKPAVKPENNEPANNTVVQPNQYEQYQYNQPQYAAPQRKGNASKIAIISIVAVVVLGALIFGAVKLFGGDSPQSVVEDAYNAVLDNDVDGFIENTILNEKAYEMLFDNDYNEDYVDGIKQVMENVDEEERKDTYFEIVNYEIMDEEDYEEYLEGKRGYFKDEDIIEEVAVVTVKFFKDKDDKGQKNKIYCYKIDGDWYMYQDLMDY